MTFPVFASGDVLNASDMNAVGLWKIAATTFTGSTGVEIQNCFSSDYENYKVFITYYGSASTNSQVQFMSGTNTKDIAATYNRWGFYWTTLINGFNQANLTSDFFANHFTAAANYSMGEITVWQPNVATYTNTTVRSWSGDSGLVLVTDNTKKTTTQYTGLYFFPASGTVTGTIRVYGLRN
jgi:hypothetical protein